LGCLAICLQHLVTSRNHKKEAVCFCGICPQGFFGIQSRRRDARTDGRTHEQNKGFRRRPRSRSRSRSRSAAGAGAGAGSRSRSRSRSREPERSRSRSWEPEPSGHRRQVTARAVRSPPEPSGHRRSCQVSVWLSSHRRVVKSSPGCLFTAELSDYRVVV